MAQFLIIQEDYTDVPVAFVLSGDPESRGTGAIQLFQQGKIGRIVCSGGNNSRMAYIFNVQILEAFIAKYYIEAYSDIPDSLVEVLPGGTSTIEESAFIFQYCEERKIDTILIITSSLHSRRTKLVFQKKAKDFKIKVFVYGADIINYDEEYWWDNDEALRFLSSEYIKLVYYWLKGYI